MLWDHKTWKLPSRSFLSIGTELSHNNIISSWKHTGELLASSKCKHTCTAPLKNYWNSKTSFVLVVHWTHSNDEYEKLSFSALITWYLHIQGFGTFCLKPPIFQKSKNTGTWNWQCFLLPRCCLLDWCLNIKWLWMSVLALGFTCEDHRHC